MTVFLQNLIVLFIVAAALFALGRRFYQFVTQAGQGGSCSSSCGGCGSQDDASSTPKALVQLEMISENPR